MLQKRKRPRSFLNVAFINAGNDLLSHTLSRAVQSALRGHCRYNRAYRCFSHLSKSTLPRLGLPGA
jgi:hypothetical protein